VELAGAVLPRLAGVDQRRLAPLPADRLQQFANDELRAIVGAQIEWRTALADQLRKHLNDAPRDAPPASSARGCSASSCFSD
jgi:hypothetical protein